MLSLSDLIADYPLLNDPLFSGKLTAKTEFRELSLGIDQPPTKPGEYFNSQKFVQRILGPHSTVDAQLVMHDVGLGKTFASTSVSESYKNGLIGPGRNKALVVVKGSTVEQSFKDNLLKMYPEYVPSDDRERTQAGQRNVITKSINEFYEIVHYIELARRIASLSDDQIREQFSDRVIIFDESHNLRMGYFAPTRSRKKALNEEERQMQDLRVYQRIWDMLHIAVRKKVILLSATPVVDRPEEFGLQMNLLLPADNQIPEDYPWDNPTVETLEPYLRGLVSYVRSSTDVPRAIEEGDIITLPSPIEDEKLTIRLVLSVMSDDQYAQYQRYSGGRVKVNPDEEDEGEVIDDDDEKAQGAFRRNERYASMFIFPRLPEEEDQVIKIEDDATLSQAEKDRLTDRLDQLRSAVGTKAFNERVTVEKNGNYHLNEDVFPQYYLSMGDGGEDDLLRYLSCKFHRIIDIVQRAPQELAFIYTEFVKGPGAILLGLCFEAQGYERYNGESFFYSGVRGRQTNTPANEDEMSPIIGTPAEFNDPQTDDRTGPTTRTARNIKMKKGKRYVVIAGNTPEKYVNNALEIFRSYENRYGEYIQAVIGTNVTREGISFRNLRQVHIAHPFWNDVPVYQAIGRALRERAHEDLLPEEREVRIYKHAAIGPGDDYQTVDIQMYAWAESKRRRIARVLRIAKRIATDCILNRVRNQERGEEDGSRACDYESCRYKCVGSEVDVYEQALPPFPEDDSTYFLYYSAALLGQIKVQIKNLFQTRTSLTLAEIVEAANVDEKYVLRALNEIIRNNEGVTSEFGQIAFLKEEGDNYFIQFEITDPEEALSFYTHNLIVRDPQSLAEFIAPLQENENTRIVEEIENIRPTDPALDERIIAVREEVKARLLERAILAENRTAVQDHIITLFENRSYAIDEDPFTKQQGEIIFHDILTQVVDRTKYVATNKSIKKAASIRILHPGREWEFVKAEEAPIYYQLIRDSDTQRREELFADQAVYGENSTIDASFRVVNKLNATKTEDRRKIKRGRVCKDFYKTDLIDILRYLNIEPPPASRRRQPVSQEVMIQTLANGPMKKTDFRTFSDDDIRFIYEWNQVNRPTMCTILEQYFRDNNLIITR